MIIDVNDRSDLCLNTRSTPYIFKIQIKIAHEDRGQLSCPWDETS